ncbi:MAG TPA: hypothetical protein VJ848_12255 [Candidatus Angelobacter sp.]|jgi:hypothetical protein|nr:hypothetical protein [Candidatus Angelobacter sp.]
MLYFKSLLAGIAAMIVAEFIVIAGAITLLFGIGWDPVSFTSTAAGLIILVLAFVGGFLWQYRRLAAREQISRKPAARS